MKYSNRRKYRDQSIEIIEETVVKKIKKKKESLFKKIGKKFLRLFKKNK